jgi:chaperonin GroES
LDDDKKVLTIWELQQSTNIEPALTDEQSDEIGRDVVDGYEIDKRSRQDWEERMENAIKLALQMVEKKNTPWPNASNVKFPLVTIGALQFSARAYPALVKVPQIVKYRKVGEDKDGAKAARAQRIGTHMSYQLLEQDEDWEEDFDKALIALPILGTVFKKSYFDPVKQHNTSKLVLPQNLVVSYYARSIEDCERKYPKDQLLGYVRPIYTAPVNEEPPGAPTTTAPATGFLKGFAGAPSLHGAK